jgi:hypothetical protein
MALECIGPVLEIYLDPVNIAVIFMIAITFKIIDIML